MNRLSRFKPCGDVASTATAKLLYLVLDHLADENGEITIPQRRISATLRISSSAVSRNLRRLRDGGYIEIHAQYRSEDGGRASNKYIVK